MFWVFEGGGRCSVYGIGVCFLCFLRSFCWEEDFAAYYNGNLQSSCKRSYFLSSSLMSHFTFSLSYLCSYIVHFKCVGLWWTEIWASLLAGFSFILFGFKFMICILFFSKLGCFPFLGYLCLSFGKIKHRSFQVFREPVTLVDKDNVGCLSFSYCIFWMAMYSITSEFQIWFSWNIIHVCHLFGHNY